MALAALAACHAPVPLAPERAYAAMSADAFRAVAARTVPSAPVAYYFHWHYDGETEVSGRGAARLAPPDSLRLDVGVPVLGRATVVFAGATEWAQPEGMADRMLPPGGSAMAWAMFGVVRPPEGGATYEQAAPEGSGPRRSFRVTEPDGVVTALEFAGDTLLAATRTRGGRTIGQLKITRDSAGALAKVEAVDQEEGARFVVTVDRREAGPFPNEIWRRP